ncbi:hypothetical protein PIB30_102160 [Stylosanthes scabra]|uniref:Uncharacterized protein n=1 Tax=Stylosanthes scabra TaxID=79078 RepID=A0ABU6YVB9_9FABA|nr:hypothetical protein [Stylosanthes scabra]
MMLNLERDELARQGRRIPPIIMGAGSGTMARWMSVGAAAKCSSNGGALGWMMAKTQPAAVENRVVVASVVAGADRGKNMGVKGAETGHDESVEQVKKREDGAVNSGGGLVGDSGGVRVFECGGYGDRRWCMVRLQRLGVTVLGGRETEGLRRLLGFQNTSGLVAMVGTAVVDSEGGGSIGWARWCSAVLSAMVARRR